MSSSKDSAGFCQDRKEGLLAEELAGESNIPPKTNLLRCDGWAECQGWI